jgi:cell division protein FtsI/penicillin-binding protein 2
MQAIAERELARAVVQYEAEGGSILVMDPRTGAILAMACWPTYDPNKFAEVFEEHPEWLPNQAVSLLYEPGSVIKVLIVAMGLEVGVITPSSTYNDTGSIAVDGAIIRNSDRQAHGTTTITRMLQKSLNLGAVNIALMLGQDRFYRYMSDFGFGQPTGITLANEEAGLLSLPTKDKNWRRWNLATNSFGQGMAATPLQVLTAIAAVANGGLLMKPYIVEQIRDGQQVTRMGPTVVRRVISAQTAREVTQMLVEVVNGEVVKAAVPGYAVAGKTGTSQVPVAEGYHPTWTIASFVGYVPADDPQLVVLVKLDKPHPQIGPHASEVAAPVFKRVVEQLLPYLDVPPDKVRLSLQRP